MAKAQTATQPRGFDLDPLHWLWRLLTSVRFALALIGALALLTLLGVLIPQLPIEMRDNPVAVSQWLALQEERFGPLTDPMYRLRSGATSSSPRRASRTNTSTAATPPSPSPPRLSKR